MNILKKAEAIIEDDMVRNETRDQDYLRCKVKARSSESHWYQCMVRLTGRLNAIREWQCTCPYKNSRGDNAMCKHAVALVLKFL